MKTQTDFMKRLNEDYELRFLKELYEAQLRMANDVLGGPLPPTDLFIRPILEYDGTSPYEGNIIYTSPDIWIGGSEAFTVEELVNNYGQSRDSNINLNRANYIYVRAKNAGTADISDRVVKLYYCDSQYVCWPKDWHPIPIIYDEKEKEVKYTASLGTTAAGKICAHDKPFYWLNPPTPKAGSHYCLIAQITNEDETFNPKPKSDLCNIDFAKMLREQCLWGQRNVNTFSSNETVSSVSKLNVSDNEGDGGEYMLMIKSTNAKGVVFDISCTKKDSKGNPIKVSPTTISDDSSFVAGCSFYMEKGYEAYATTYLHKDSIASGQVCSIQPTLYFPGKNSEMDFAVRNHLIDFESSVAALDNGLRTNAVPLISLGGVQVKVK